MYIAASDELFAYTPDFRPRRAPGAIAISSIATRSQSTSARLYLTSTGYDSILGFDLDRARVPLGNARRRPTSSASRGRIFDPRTEDGPLMLNKLHVNSVHCTEGGMYITGLRTGGMLLYNGKQVQMAAELPPGSHNARPFRDGVLFNDTEADALRYAGRGEGREDRALPVPRYAGAGTAEPRRRRDRRRSPGLCARSVRAVRLASSPAARRRRPSRSTTSPPTNGCCR